MPSDQSSLHSNLSFPFEDDLHVSAEKTLCSDAVLCYLSNLLQHHLSVDDVEKNFTSEQLDQAVAHLRSALAFVLAQLDREKDPTAVKFFERCSSELNDWTSVLPIFTKIEQNGFASHLPIFVTHNWIELFQQMQRSRTIPSVQDELLQLTEHLTNFQQLIDEGHQGWTPVEQCCLRQCCSHDSQMFRSVSSLSSWSSMETDVNSITGFIRNPVTNFLIRTDPKGLEMDHSIISIDEDSCSDDDESQVARTAPPLHRSLSSQPTLNRSGSILVKRNEDLWIYPTGIPLKTRINPLLFSSVRENSEEDLHHRLITRRNSCDERFHQIKQLASSPKKTPKKSKKIRRGSIDRTEICAFRKFPRRNRPFVSFFSFS